MKGCQFGDVQPTHTIIKPNKQYQLKPEKQFSLRAESLQVRGAQWSIISVAATLLRCSSSPAYRSEADENKDTWIPKCIMYVHFNRKRGRAKANERAKGEVDITRRQVNARDAGDAQLPQSKETDDQKLPFSFCYCCCWSWGQWWGWCWCSNLHQSTTAGFEWLIVTCQPPSLTATAMESVVRAATAGCRVAWSVRQPPVKTEDEKKALSLWLLETWLFTSPFSGVKSVSTSASDAR